MRSSTSGIGCIVLAAGSGTRFGSDKRLALLGGRSLLDTTLANIAPVFDKRILVLRAGDEALGNRHASDWQIVLAANAGKGMGHSLAAAMALVALSQVATIAGALREATDRHLLQASDNEVMQFRHNLVREAVNDELLP